MTVRVITAPATFGRIRPRTQRCTRSCTEVGLGRSHHRGVTSGTVLSVAPDSLRGVTLAVSTDQPKRTGAAGDLIVGRDGELRWTQDLWGTPCKARAMLNAATATTPQVLSGNMSCDGVESAFTLKKTA